MNTYITILLFLILLYFNLVLSKETFESSNICVKKIDNTTIELINHRWTNDFKKRFENHEPNSNLKLKELLSKLPNDSFIIDVGSHVGDTGIYLSKILQTKYSDKNINVIMIDPEESKIEFIKKMGEKNNLKNIITIVSGVSDTKGNGAMDKSLHPGGWKIDDKSNGNIKIDTIDNLCKGKNISLFHIDVEGMEYKCLLGSVETIKNVEYIMIELNSIINRNAEVDFLTKNNFIDINDTKLQKENGNHLFKKNK